MDENLQLPVRVTIRTTSRNERGQQEDDLRMMTTGTLSRHKDGSLLLRYSETMQDEEGNVVQTGDVRLKMQESQVIMLRSGPYGTTMVFSRGQRFEGTYHTPYGDMDMAVYTTRLLVSAGPERGRVAMEYQLDMNGGFSSVRKMTVDYLPEERAD